MVSGDGDMLFQEIVWASNFISAGNGGCLPFVFVNFITELRVTTIHATSRRDP